MEWLKDHCGGASPRLRSIAAADKVRYRMFPTGAMAAIGSSTKLRRNAWVREDQSSVASEAMVVDEIEIERTRPPADAAPPPRLALDAMEHAQQRLGREMGSRSGRRHSQSPVD